ncbi:hypothetical protein BJY01DRAFT_254982 [Aspergillus pseudoustus]|uniref:Uncharacterized protein n=1 Tax=Aspergillus pseudoustus TaxID=1810923 RepID=A0ABR4IPQ5_9EURO
MDVHVVSKTDNNTHATFSLPTPTSPLAGPSSLRIRPSLLSLTSNNLTYALLGNQLKWWDAYPVPSNAPTPYNDASAWGIVPAWGFGTVLESTIESIAPGTKLWGYWPASGHVVDLALKHEPDEPSTHWIEVSPHRQTLLALYNRYLISTSDDETRHAWEASVRPVWQCAYVLSAYVFTPDPASNPAIHPYPGIPSVKETWTSADADLSRAVVISLAASSKTARAVAHNFTLRPTSGGPLGLLQVTSAPGPIQSAATALKPHFATRAVDYTSLDTEEVAQWIAALKPAKILVIDFGSRDGGFEAAHKLVSQDEVLAKAEFVTVNIGYQQKVYTMSDVGAALASAAEHSKIQFNTSPVIEAILPVQGATKLFAGLEKAWDHWLENREAAAPDLQLVWGEGVVGEKGIEGAWTRLTRGEVKPEEALVFRI